MTAEETFWAWFEANEQELFSYQPLNENLFNRIATELQKVDCDLTFEIGPVQSAQREFIVSASGIKRAFPSVINVVQAAPRLPRWVVIAFRPRRKDIGVVEIQGRKLDPKEVRYSLLDNGSIAGVYLYIPGFIEGDPIFKQLGYLLLDDALGEYDVETKLGLIKMVSSSAVTSDDPRPLSSLPEQFDQLVRQLSVGDQ